MVDSFSVRMSTVKLDSIPTSATTVGLIGFFENSATGSVQANTYANFDLTSTISGISDEEVFDSITIQLFYSGYQVGDTTQLQKLQVYRLTNQLALREADDSKTYLYNTSSFPHENTSCGKLDYYPNDADGSIEIRLDDAIGQDIIQKVMDDADEVANNTNFNEYLKGFVIMPTYDSGRGIIGFSADSTQLTIYAHHMDFEKVEDTFAFTVSSDNTYYNQIITDRSGTPFESLSGQREELLSTSSGNLAYIEGSAGVVARIDFPSLNDIFKLENKILLKAELELRPADETYETELPTKLDFYKTDKVNRIGDQLTYTNSSGSSVSLEASLSLDELYHDNSSYTIDLTTFLSDELSGNYYDTNDGLIITVPLSDLLSTADLLILNGEKNKSNKPKLKLYFLTYE